MNKKVLTLLEELEEFGKHNYMFNVPKETGELLNLLINF